jgi:beta-glucosidase
VITWNLEKTDKDTYSENVENALQDCNINNLIPNTVEYATRSDWTKGWETIDSLTPTEEMMAGLTNSKTELTENGDGVTWGADNGLTIFDLVELDADGNFAGVKDIDDEMWDQLIEEMTLEEAIQFIAYGGDDLENINSIIFPRSYMNDGPVGFTADQIANYMTRWTSGESDNPTYVASDDPYGDSSMAVMPTEPVVAATFNQELVEREGELDGEDGLWSKESVIIAPGANLHRTPYCARNHEYYSEDSQLTNLMTSAFCKGAESKGLLTDVKHFAFNHQETNRSGMSVFFTEQAARENELRCFQGVMSNNLAGSSMTAFNRAGVDYVGAKSGLLVQIARNEWGYTGAFVTDMINGADYMNWRDIVFNGGGIALTESAYATSNIGLMEDAEDQIAKDTAFQQEMQKSIKYWMYNMAQTNTINGLSATSEIQNVTPWWLGLCYAGDVLFAALTILFIALHISRRKKA